MNSLLDELEKEEVWQTFLTYKKERKQLSKKQISELETFIAQKRYRHYQPFSYPQKKELSKLGSNRKRIVYTYPKDETWILKLLAFLLYKYDDRLSANCYSFRKGKTAKTAFTEILKIEDLDEHYVLKLDIHDYFNSIDIGLLISTLKKTITDDERLLGFLESLLKQDACFYDGTLIKEKRGAMAGVSLSSFFANIYLADLDRHFLQKDIPYFRYADDIIIFLKNKEEIKEAEETISTFLNEKKLTLNKDKHHLSKPHEGFDFLGFSYQEKTIDLSAVTIRKIKDKIRRKAHSLYRWRKRKGAGYEKTAAALIRSFDQKFYDLSGDNEFTWTRYFFPVITTHEGLQKVDEHLQRYLRYLYSGRHCKGNYRITYEKLKKLGYTPLVNEYHRWKKENEYLSRKNKQTVSKNDAHSQGNEL